jgi:hypothetical protein
MRSSSRSRQELSARSVSLSGVRLVALLFVAVVVAACGSTSEEVGTPASSDGMETALPAETIPVDEDPLEGKLKPPKILLVSKAGEQRATEGSYCVDFVVPLTGQGQGVCADSAGPTYPESVSDVNAGEEVTLLLEGAILKAESTVTIRALGCDSGKEAALVWKADTRELPWEVQLDPGFYQVDVFALFAADDGRSGDVSGSLGLNVLDGPDVALHVRPAEPSMRACP